MTAELQAAPVSNKMLWAGRIVSALPVLMLAFSGVMKLAGGDPLTTEFSRLGYPGSLIIPLAIVELSCTALYVIPRTSVLGAILLTGYLGGAVATHVRIGDEFVKFFAPIVFGMLVWGGLYLRDARLRALMPLKG